MRTIQFDTADAGTRPLYIRVVLLCGVFCVAMISACSNESTDEAMDGDAGLSGAVLLDGSSTVYPISEAVAEEYRYVAPRVRVTVGVSGTGGGFKKFLAGDTDINDASRVIKPSEVALAEANGIAYLELPVAFDGLSIVVNPNNDWVDYLTVQELSLIWGAGSTVDSWDDIRAEWPNVPIRLYGPGTDSGTFDYFTEVINGMAGSARPDYTASEDDNVLVQGIIGDTSALGFFGFAYYSENRDKLRLIPIDNGSGPVAPDAVTINNGDYNPLSRPVFIYVNAESMARAEVKSFVEFYLDNAAELANEVGYVEMPADFYQTAIDVIERF